MHDFYKLPVLVLKAQKMQLLYTTSINLFNLSVVQIQ